MKKVLKTALLLITLVGFISCHKYPKDPFISFRKPIVRLDAGWQITSYRILGKEHSHDFDNLLSPNTLTDVKIDFNYGIHPADDIYTTLIPQFPIGTYTISSDNKTFTFFPAQTDSIQAQFLHEVFQGQIDNIHHTISSMPTWTIVELYGKHFHIFNNGTDIFFKKQ
ncbi:MAG TPA: hypothetical protein VF411_08995 [Bacteroidia bacterium]